MEKVSISFYEQECKHNLMTKMRNVGQVFL